MGLQLNFNDQYEENYPASYWRVVQCNLSKDKPGGLVVFSGYMNEANAGKRIVGQMAYTVTSDLYEQFFLPSLIQPQGIDHIKQCYALALAVKNVDSGTKDDEGNPIMVSFFNGATDV